MALPAALITGLFGLGSSLLKGLGKSSQQKRLRRDWEKRLSMLKPGGAFSRGRDPVVQAAIANMFLSRGMANPYGNMPGLRPGGGITASRTSGKAVLKRLTRSV